ncbi:MAG: aromatic ring-hydroxylating dioxygenase subunit alpha [Actinomycetota bacterium]
MSAVPEEFPEPSESWDPVPTLPGPSYFHPEVWEQEQEKVFAAEWICVGRAEELPESGDLVTREVGTESVIVVRGKDRVIRGFFNVCVHRGTRLCDPGAGHAKSGVIKCPYHAWTYDTTGKLVGTPNVLADEGFDRSRYPLHTIAVQEWNGFVFVNLSEAPAPMEAFLARNPEGDPTRFCANWHLDELRIAETITYGVAANWKVIVDNYNECLHCPGIHPALVDLVPLYRRGLSESVEGARLADGVTTLTTSGTTSRPSLPDLTAEECSSYAGNTLFPTLLINLQADCAMTYRLEPQGPDRTRIVSDYLFHPDTIAREDFDPSDVVELWDLISRQDWAVCERAQLGMASRSYREGGVYPYNDRWIAAFNDRYQESMA